MCPPDHLLGLATFLAGPLIHHVRALAAKTEIVRFRRHVLQIASPLAVAGPLDIALELSEKPFVVTHSASDARKWRQVRRNPAAARHR